MGVLKCKECHQVVEYRKSDLIRCEKHYNKHQAARCPEPNCTRYKADDNTAAAFEPESYCRKCQATTFSGKANEAEVAELIRSLDNTIDLGHIKSSYLPMTNQEIKRLTKKPNVKPSIFIPRKPKRSINTTVKKAETLVHHTAKGQITKASEKAKIHPQLVTRSKVPQHVLHELLASMTVN